MGLMDIYENMYDLMPIFKSKNYYKKEMEGSYSIKKVLPALFPNDQIGLWRPPGSEKR